MIIPKQVVISEQRLLEPLEKFFLQTWDETKLWSHDLDHHRRVWNNAKELLACLTESGQSQDQVFTDKLIIACLLHDSGMAVEMGEKHGKAGRKFCEDFLISIDIDPDTCEDLLSAIEHHDDKNYHESLPGSQLFNLLSAADDLDAFGYTGVYRYLEIYMMRGISPKEIGTMVVRNSSSRFSNFSKNFGSFPELIEKHRERFLIVRDFFQNFSEEQSTFS